MSKRRTRRKFSKDFKAEALGVPRELLYRWRQAVAAEDTDAFRGNGHRTEQDKEIFELKRKVAEL
jgi:transposase-like protein